MEIEKTLVSAWLNGRGLETLHEMRPDWFENPQYRILCESVQEMYSDNETISPLTVHRKTGITAYDIATITGVYMAQDVNSLAAIVRQDYTKRSIVNICTDFAQGKFEDPFEAIELIQGKIDVLRLTDNKQFKQLYDICIERASELDERRKKDVKTIGLPSGFNQLDKYIGGFVAGESIVVAGRPGMGKTAFAVSIGISHATISKLHKVVMFSFEMSNTQVADRVLSMTSRIDNLKIRQANIDDFEMGNIFTGIHNLDIDFEIEDSTHLTVDQIAAKVKAMKKRPTLVIIDYIGLVKSQSGRNREQEISYISRKCKMIAKDNDCTVMPLSQLNRDTEQGSSRPKLSNLRESGAIEQDADTVLFPYRPAYYRAQNGEQTPDIEDDAEIIIGKCRNGITGSIGVRFQGSTVTYLP